MTAVPDKESGVTPPRRRRSPEEAERPERTERPPRRRTGAPAPRGRRRRACQRVGLSWPCPASASRAAPATLWVPAPEGADRRGRSRRPPMPPATTSSQDEDGRRRRRRRGGRGRGRGGRGRRRDQRRGRGGGRAETPRSSTPTRFRRCRSIPVSARSGTARSACPPSVVARRSRAHLPSSPMSPSRTSLTASPRCRSTCRRAPPAGLANAAVVAAAAELSLRDRPGALRRLDRGPAFSRGPGRDAAPVEVDPPVLVVLPSTPWTRSSRRLAAIHGARSHLRCRNCSAPRSRAGRRPADRSARVATHPDASRLKPDAGRSAGRAEEAAKPKRSHAPPQRPRQRHRRRRGRIRPSPRSRPRQAQRHAPPAAAASAAERRRRSSRSSPRRPSPSARPRRRSSAAEAPEA